MPLMQILNGDLIWAKFSACRLYKDVEEGKFWSLLACLCFSNISIPSLVVEPTSSGFCHILKTSCDIHPWGLNSYWNLQLSVHNQPLLD